MATARVSVSAAFPDLFTCGRLPVEMHLHEEAPSGAMALLRRLPRPLDCLAGFPAPAKPVTAHDAQTELRFGASLSRRLAEPLPGLSVAEVLALFAGMQSPRRI